MQFYRFFVAIWIVHSVASAESLLRELDVKSSLNSSSNVGRYSGAPGGSSIQIQIDGANSFEISQSLIGYLTVQGGSSLFLDQDLAKNFNQAQLEGGGGLLWLSTSALSFGGGASYKFVDARQINFSDPTSVSGLPSRHNTLGVDVSLTYLFSGRSSVELGGSFISSAHQTDIVDENGSIFRDDNQTTSVGLSQQIEISKTLKNKLTLSYGRRRYEERAARFSTGLLAPGNTGNPLLEEEFFSIGDEIELKLSSLEISLSGGYSVLTDQVFGAGDSENLSFGSKVTYALSSKVDLNADLSLSQKTYKNFIGDIAANSFSLSRRKDNSQSLSVSANRKFQSFTALFKYSIDSVESNYVDSNGNPLASFTDQGFSVGIEHSF